MLRNPIRDQFQAFVVSENGYFPPKDFWFGLWHAIMGKAGRSDLYEQWARAGGGYGNFMSVDRNYLREQLRQLKREGHPLNKGFKTIVNPKEWLRLLQALSELSEEATKLGEFRLALKKGKTLEEAAFQSRDLMDFARSGSAIKEWNKVITFLNANIQGKDKLLRSARSNPARFFLRAITGVTLPTIGAYLAMQYLANEKQKETWMNTPQWMKETFFIVPIPGTNDLARIPKPFDLAYGFSNPAEHMLDHIYNNDPQSFEEFAKNTAVGLLKIPYMLTGIAPLIENWANKSFFTEMPIVPQRDQDLLPEDQYGVSTSLTARTLGKTFNYSPYKIDNLIRGYGAGLGRYATAGLDKVLEKAGVGKLPPQEAKKISELPLINAFTVDSTGGGKIMNVFYEKLDLMNKEAKSAEKNGRKYEKEEQLKKLRRTSREISEIRNKYREVQGSYELTPEQKRKKLDEYDRKMRQLAKEALSQIE
jgi:Large polyvalent protein associated domain 38